MRSLGLNYKRTRLIIILLPVFWQEYAFAGLIAYRLAVPHIAKLVFRPVTTLYYFEYLLFWSEYHAYL
jgi:ABC-type Fe3+-siderophore transport system permease subunit